MSSPKDYQEPFIPAEQQLPEITGRVIFLSVILTVILAMSNAYLALKIGILASASIPAAIISMSVLRFYKGSNILQNNLVQTAASAGEAVAGGIVYTLPALILIHYWQHFNYFETFAIALCGGMLGVFFSIPIRRVLVTEESLHFPEGRAIAEVLIAGSRQHFGLKEILSAGSVGAILEFLQMGLKIFAAQIQAWFVVGQSVVGFGAGFSATMLGVGYIIGFNVGVSILVGVLLGWVLGIPLMSYLTDATQTAASAQQIAMSVWEQNIRYLGIGAMLVAGIWTLLTLLRPFASSLMNTYRLFNQQRAENAVIRTERDMPLSIVVFGTLLFLVILYYLFQAEFPLQQLQVSENVGWMILWGSLLYVLVLGFISCVITGYFSGLVGVTASPGSAIIIAGLLIAAILLRMIINFSDVTDLAQSKLAAAGITIFLGAIVTGAAAIANDNIQDLKVGHIVGSTPWKQQCMLMLGVVLAALVIPWVMELLFNVYGIGDVLPRAGMDPSQSLPAPPAALMAAVTQGVLNYALPWNMILLGGALILLFVSLNRFLFAKDKQLSILGVAIGIYLPLTTSVPLVMGSFVALLCERRLQLLHSRGLLDAVQVKFREHRGILIACGLVAGAAIMNILLAVPFAIGGSPDLLRIMPADLAWLASILTLISVMGILYWLYISVCKQED